MISDGHELCYLTSIRCGGARCGARLRYGLTVMVMRRCAFFFSQKCNKSNRHNEPLLLLYSSLPRTADVSKWGALGAARSAFRACSFFCFLLHTTSRYPGSYCLHVDSRRRRRRRGPHSRAAAPLCALLLVSSGRARFCVGQVSPPCTSTCPYTTSSSPAMRSTACSLTDHTSPSVNSVLKSSRRKRL